MPVNDHVHHAPDATGVAQIQQIRMGIIQMEQLMDALCPQGRDLAVAKTHLETARMWAIAAIAKQYPGEALPATGAQLNRAVVGDRPTGQSVAADWTEPVPVQAAELDVTGSDEDLEDAN